MKKHLLLFSILLITVLVVNAQSRKYISQNVEFNFKVLLMDRMWIGAGHRVAYANNLQVGYVLGELRMGYIYEIPMLRSYLLPYSTHELMLTYSLFKDGTGMIW